VKPPLVEKSSTGSTDPVSKLRPRSLTIFSSNFSILSAAITCSRPRPPSDTVILNSPTTTFEYTYAVEGLSVFTGIDHGHFVVEIFSAATSIPARYPGAGIASNFKLYRDFGTVTGIGQIEVLSLPTI
jgi:hypothetical protein